MSYRKLHDEIDFYQTAFIATGMLVMFLLPALFIITANIPKWQDDAVKEYITRQSQDMLDECEADASTYNCRIEFVYDESGKLVDGHVASTLIKY